MRTESLVGRPEAWWAKRLVAQSDPFEVENTVERDSVSPDGHGDGCLSERCPNGTDRSANPATFATPALLVAPSSGVCRSVLALFAVYGPGSLDQAGAGAR